MKYAALVTMSASFVAIGSITLAQSLTINSFGGVYEENHRHCVITPFESETGTNVQVVTAYSADAIAQLRAQRDAPLFDIVHFSGGQEIVGAREGLLAPIDESRLSNISDLAAISRPNLAGGEGPAYSIAALGLVYNSDTAPAAPTSWADLGDPALAERLVLTDFSNVYGLLGFLMINQVHGGDLTNIQPGLDAVSAMLTNGAIVVSTAPEILQEFTQNEAWVAPYASDYAFTLRNAGLPVQFVQGTEGTPGAFFTVNMVAGRPNEDLALRFIDMTISPEAQACFAERMRYSPTNQQAKLSPETAAGVVAGEMAQGSLIRFDPTIIDQNRSAWTEAWNRTIAR